VTALSKFNSSATSIQSPGAAANTKSSVHVVALVAGCSAISKSINSGASLSNVTSNA